MPKWSATRSGPTISISSQLAMSRCLVMRYG
jgi:hypothetical protein